MSEQELFEKWHYDRHRNIDALNKFSPSVYEKSTTDAMWCAWKARAELAKSEGNK